MSDDPMSRRQRLPRGRDDRHRDDAIDFDDRRNVGADTGRYESMLRAKRNVERDEMRALPSAGAHATVRSLAQEARNPTAVVGLLALGFSVFFGYFVLFVQDKFDNRIEKLETTQAAFLAKAKEREEDREDIAAQVIALRGQIYAQQTLVSRLMDMVAETHDVPRTGRYTPTETPVSRQPWSYGHEPYTPGPTR